MVDYAPTISKGMESLLQYTGADLAEVFELRFAVDVDSYGQRTVVEFVPGGAGLRVTQENKAEYVRRYIDWLFTRSVKDQFAAFDRGFYKLCSRDFIRHCEPEELELLICGSPKLDFHELEKHTVYENGYHPSSPVIKYEKEL